MSHPIKQMGYRICVLVLFLTGAPKSRAQDSAPQVGRETAIPVHLQDGDEFATSIHRLIQYGEKLFNARFTVQEGAGRPLSKGTGAALSDLTSPLIFPDNFDRVSAPEANACSGCHNAPVVGGGGCCAAVAVRVFRWYGKLHKLGIKMRGLRWRISAGSLPRRNT
jgi:hypothetical protein